METTYYTLYTRESKLDIAQASGGEDRLVMFTQRPTPKKLPPREDNVIPFADYLPQLTGPSDNGDGDRDEAEAPEAQAPEAVGHRPRTDHSWDWIHILEAAACLAVLGVAVAACLVLLV